MLPKNSFLGIEVILCKINLWVGLVLRLVHFYLVILECVLMKEDGYIHHKLK